MHTPYTHARARPGVCIWLLLERIHDSLRLYIQSLLIQRSLGQIVASLKFKFTLAIAIAIYS